MLLIAFYSMFYGSSREIEVFSVSVTHVLDTASSRKALASRHQLLGHHHRCHGLQLPLASKKPLPLSLDTPPLQGFFYLLPSLSLSARWSLPLATVSEPLSWVMAVLVSVLLILAFTGHSSATWCVCKEGDEVALQKTLDYACGAGADCGPIHQNGVCYQPNSVKAHCSYAANSYFQRKGQAPGSCDFSGTATVTSSDPSLSGCVFPSSASPVNGGTIPVSGTPSTTNPGTGFTPTTNTPFGSSNPTGILGSGSNGVSPSGAGMNTDYSDDGFRIQVNTIFFTFLISLLFSWLVV